MESALPLDQHGPRARFVALRRKIFEEMGVENARWRITWLLPFHVSVLVVLLTHGQTGWRATVQIAAVVACGVLSAIQLVRPSVRSTGLSLVGGMVCFFAVLVATGGLASPLLCSGLPMLVGASVALAEPAWAKRAFFAAFFGGFLLLALLSQTSLGDVGAPLMQHEAWISPEFVLTSVVSLAFVVAVSYRMGCSVSAAYERVALELAERREELCTETEDRTRALEGIAARLAHEVKNPLAAIKGLSDAHGAKRDRSRRPPSASSIVAAEADRLQSIVDGFLSFSRGSTTSRSAPTKPLRDRARARACFSRRALRRPGVELGVTGERRPLGRRRRAQAPAGAAQHRAQRASRRLPRGTTVTIDVAARLRKRPHADQGHRRQGQA